MIAFHFPPLRGSSGIQRTLRFVQHLPDFGWRPIVLTAHPRAYENRGDDLLAQIPAGTEIIRSAAWDAARHLTILGKYPRFAARPDRWISWLPGAVFDGTAAIRRFRPAALWSTYPIATAHKIGLQLAQRSGLPWVADFRDPMAQDNYPRDPAIWKQFARIECATVSRAGASIFTTPSAAATYRTKYPRRSSRIHIIENGYDEESFLIARVASTTRDGCVTLLHSGVVYPSERDPTALFAALAILRRSNPTLYSRLRLRFRAPVHEDLLHSLAVEHDVSNAIEVMPALAYSDAIGEMLSSDALLLLQAANCNEQIPAKLYEYLRARRPIVALTDPRGDTAATLLQAGVGSIAPLDDPVAIKDLLARVAENPHLLSLPSDTAVAGASRRGRAKELADLLDSVSEPRRARLPASENMCELSRGS